MKSCHLARLLLALLLALAGGCASTPARKAKPGPPAPYMRVARPDGDTVELQIAVRKFLPPRGDGPAIWLAGASHIGESNYYTALQAHLDARTLVLYEGVGEHARKRASRTTTKSPAPSPPRPTKPAADPTPAAASLQVTMAKSLGLAFQLEAIDYGRTNFLNSDLTLQQIQALMQPPKKQSSGVRATDDDDSSFQQLLGAMDGSSVFGALASGLFQIIGSSPKLQAMTKLALIEVFGQIKGDMAQMQGMPQEMQRLFEVLIRERNNTVIADLREELRRVQPTDSIAIFYGAGHLVDMEKRLRHDLHYVPVDELWLPVFSVNTERAGLSGFELNLLRSIIRSQLAPLNAE